MNKLEPYQSLLKELHNKEYEAYFVGGCVRNFLLKRKIDDVDIATNAPVEEIMEIFKRFKLNKIGIAFFSVSFTYKRKSITITPFRYEGKYIKHRYPSSVSYTDDIKVDAKRRDFTMNALYMDDEKNIIDFYDGQHHIKQKLLVSVKNPDRSMAEDSLRILRALRFVVVYNLRLDEPLERAIRQHASLVNRLSRHTLDLEVKKLQDQATVDQQTEYYKLLVKYNIKM
jgi:tRNA nucleotidyltransferase (CCA-adding enzyme)